MSLWFGHIQQDGTVSNYLEASTSEILFSLSGGSQYFNISSNISWSISADFWIELDKSTGSGNDTIMVTIDESESNRDGQIEITGSGLTEYISIIQSNE